MALGKAVEQMFEVEIDRRPMTKKTMREYNLFIRSVLNYANDKSYCNNLHGNVI